MEPSGRPQSVSSRSRSRSQESADISPFERTKMKLEDSEQEQSDVEALRAQVQLLKSEIQLLKNLKAEAGEESLVDLSPELNVDEQIGRCTSITDVVTLPTVVLSQIFNNIIDTQTLLGCRSVCTSWKSVIDNTPALIRRFTFLVLHPSLFLDLTNIVPHVRSIKFAQVRPSTEEELKNLVSAIAPTLESVTFDFDTTKYFTSTADQQRRIASSVLRECSKLNELRIICFQKATLLADLDNPLLTNITSLTINPISDECDADDLLKEFILKLSSLSTLACVYKAANEGMSLKSQANIICTAACQHILKYTGVLKKFEYGAGDSTEFEHTDSDVANRWTELFLIAGRHGVVVSRDWAFELRNLCDFEQKDNYEVTMKNCSGITNGLFTQSVFHHINAHRMNLCVNIEEVKFELRPETGPTTPDTLSILWRLQKLKKLSLRGYPRAEGLSEVVFEQGLPTVQTLIMRYDVFGSTAVFTSLHLYFSNLVELCLVQLSVPDDLFVSLARLDKLCSLELVLFCIPGLTEIVFQFPQPNSRIPAIAALSKLKKLRFRTCRGLTDNCLINGILHSTTLQTLTIDDYSCSGITEVGFAAITDGRGKKKRFAKHGLNSDYTFTLN